MDIDLAKLHAWLRHPEGEDLEFKEAKNGFPFDKLVKYCVALANEGGGKIVLGVGDRIPRQIVGTSAFHAPEQVKKQLLQRLRLRVDVEELQDAEGRVLVFIVPSRPVGMPVQDNGSFWMRSGDSLVPMTSDRLKSILEEAGPDFSAEACEGATISDLDPALVSEFRSRWARKSQAEAIRKLPSPQLLADAELLVDGRATYAALILLGTRQALRHHLPQAEVILEYRASPASGPANERLEFGQGFFGYYKTLWQQVALRNDVQHYREGLFVYDIRTFNEGVVREALLNAVSHRDYRLGGSIFIRQYPRRMEIVSPGGFPPGVTAENLLWRQSPRNRRIAEVFARCGLVERAGQGANLMFERCIQESKALPDYTGTDDYQVALTLHGEVQDPAFLRFLEKVGRERLDSFSTEDFLIIDHVYRDEPVPEFLRRNLTHLIDGGILERVGKGKSTRYILSRRFYGHLGKEGTYTRKRGLDRETKKALLLKHIRDHAVHGSQLSKLRQVLPELSRAQVQVLLRQLRDDGEVHCVGRTRSARWYPGPEPGTIASDDEQ